MKNLDADKKLEKIKRMENMVGESQFEIQDREDIKVNIRVNESVGPAKFRQDPFMPNGYIANSLTIRAMRADIFVLGDSLDDFEIPYSCACGEEIDAQFWKLCPYCARTILT